MTGPAFSPKYNAWLLYRERGVSLFEFAIALAVIALLTGFFLLRFRVVQREAELAEVQQVVGVMRSALRMKEAGIYAHGGAGELTAPAGQNPMSLLARPPNNYLGEYYAPDINRLKSGSWYYDPGKQTLFYLMHNRKHSTRSEIKLLKFKKHLLRAEPDRGNLPFMRYSIILDEMTESLD